MGSNHLKFVVFQLPFLLLLGVIARSAVGQEARQEEARPEQRIQVSTVAIAVSPDGRLLATCGATVALWDLPTGKVKATVEAHAGQVRALAFSPDGKWLATGGGDRNVCLWDGLTLAPKATLQGHDRAVNAVVFSPDGKLLASGGNDRSVIVWTVADSRKLTAFHDDEAYFVHLAFSPKSARLAAAGLTSTIPVWNPTSRKTLAAIANHTDEVEAVAFLTEDRVASAGLDRLVRVWDLAAEKEVLQVEGSTGGCLSASSDGKYLASVDSKGLVVVWDASTGKRLADFGDGRRAVRSVLFASDNRAIIYSDGASVAVMRFDPGGKRP